VGARYSDEFIRWPHRGWGGGGCHEPDLYSGHPVNRSVVIGKRSSNLILLQHFVLSGDIMTNQNGRETY
jgi:hypothetical protein